MKEVSVFVVAAMALCSLPCAGHAQPAPDARAQEIAPPPPVAESAEAVVPAPAAASGDRAPAAKIWDGTKELGSRTGEFFTDAAKKTGSFFGNGGKKTGAFFKGLFVKE
jgi:hypothetical protein